MEKMFHLKSQVLNLFFEGQGAIIRNHQLSGKQVLVYDIGGKNDTMLLFGSNGKTNRR